MFFRRNKEPVSWIVVFLGNPGVKYENTRHNAGFMVADVIEKKANIKLNKIKFNSLTAITTIGEQQV
ncbi:MAG: aminoacyl-tRNA hydrolase, partial [Oscillospiraceae bacterium]|nr:aminoacyl-tRNA hydrolase [Oscillospiraceae bacterium]MDR2599187.1 aminoacyl-tRNA hydrolase [Oscillospiraceae bacterium]